MGKLARATHCASFFFLLGVLSQPSQSLLLPLLYQHCRYPFCPWTDEIIHNLSFCDLLHFPCPRGFCVVIVFLWLSYFLRIIYVEALGKTSFTLKADWCPMLYLSFIYPFIHWWTFGLLWTIRDLGVQISLQGVGLLEEKVVSFVSFWNETSYCFP